MSKFTDYAKQANEILFSKFGVNHVSHTMDFSSPENAESYLLSLSMIDGTSFSDMSAPDHMQIIPILHDDGVFVILGGVFTVDQHKEIRDRGVEAAGYVRSICPAGSGQVNEDLLTVLNEED